jgi:hypothetical protein
MSEEKPKSYMQELNQWIEDRVIIPLTYGDPPDDPESRSPQEITDQVYQAIRDKVLESYKNGLRGGAGAVRREQKYAQAKTR